MGSQASRSVLDLIGFLGLVSLGVAIYFAVGLRSALPWHTDVFENIAFGKFFVGAVYGCLAVLFFWMYFTRV
jgi:hypothetical protein